MKDSVFIEVFYDGWSIGTKHGIYKWDHNEENYGTEALAKLFTDLGYDVTVEEVY